MASLTGNQIKDTYEGLLKTTDNDVLGSSAKVITDGAGNASGLSLDTNGNVAVAADLSVGDELIVTGAASVGGTLTLDGALIDSNGSSGTGGQVLASTVTGTDWVSLSEISGVDGTGTADKIAKWSDTDSIANSTITDNGSLVSFATPISVTGAVTSTGANTASSFVKTGGTSSQFLKADGSVDGTVYATEADLTTAEGRISVNEGDIVAIEAKTDYITVTQAVNLDTMESDIAGVKTKTDFITVTQAVDLDDMEADIATNASDIATNASAITTKVSKSGDTMTGNLTSTGFIKTGGTSSQFLKADGSVDSSTYLTAESDTLDAVTDRGATTTNSIAVGNVTATSFIKSGGTSAQFLKADGSIDSNAYITAESDTLDSVTDRGAVTTNTVTVGDFNAQASSLNSLSVVTTSSFTGDAAFDTDTLFVDVSADRVGVNTNAPTEALDVVGNVKASGTLAVSGAATLSSTLAVTGISTLTGNVGIGISPSAPLDVSAPDGTIKLTSSTGTNFTSIRTINTGGTLYQGIERSAGGVLGITGAYEAFLFYGADNPLLIATNNSYVRLATNGAERMRIHSAGDISFRDSSANEAFYWDASAARLGIGTDVPSRKLEVYAVNPAFALKSSTTTGYSELYFADSDSDSVGFINYSHTDDELVFGTNGSSKMRIDSSGNVGIGVAPSAKLDVYSGSSGVVANFSGPNAYGAETGILLSQSRAKISGFLNTGGATPGSNLRFYTMPDSGSVTERMRIDSSGQVGVGVSPSYKLHTLIAAGSSNGIGLLNTSGQGLKIYTDSTAANADVYIQQGGTGSSLIFRQNTSERMRITSGGFLKASNDGTYAGVSSSYHEMRSDANTRIVAFSNKSSTLTEDNGILIQFTAAAPNNTVARFIVAEDTSASRFVVYSNGNVVNTNNSYGAISDAKLKENVVDASPKLEDLMQVQVRNFNYIGDDKKQLGVVAQELEQVFPSMIDESPDHEERDVEVRDEEGNIVYKTEQVLVSEAVLDEEGNVVEEAVYETIVTDEPEMTKEKFDLGTVTKSVKYSVFVPMLIKAIQELNAKVESLEAQLNA